MNVSYENGGRLKAKRNLPSTQIVFPEFEELLIGVSYDLYALKFEFEASQLQRLISDYIAHCDFENRTAMLAKKKESLMSKWKNMEKEGVLVHPQALQLCLGLVEKGLLPYDLLSPEIWVHFCDFVYFTEFRTRLLATIASNLGSIEQKHSFNHRQVAQVL